MSNNEKGFGFLDFFGMGGNSRIILFFLALIIVLVSSISSLDLRNKVDKILSALNPIYTVKGKLIYVKALDEFVGYPPYGEIYIYDYTAGKDQRITFDEYYDASPTYSKHFNTIFFESKRKSDVDYQLMSAQSDLFGYNLESGKVKNSRELIAFSLEYDDSDILSPIISSYNDSLIAFFEKKYTAQNLIVCNYLSKKVMVRQPIKPHTRTDIDDFLRNYVSIYDASTSSSTRFGTYFISLDSNNTILQIPDTFKSQYYFTGKGEGNAYFAVSKEEKEKLNIFSYKLPDGEFSLVNEIHSSEMGKMAKELTVESILNKDKIIFYFFSEGEEKFFVLNKGSMKLLLSSKHEITDFEFH